MFPDLFLLFQSNKGFEPLFNRLVCKYFVCMLKFEWNSDKERVNRDKHGVAFKEARSVFYDEDAIQFFDESHSLEEDRFIMLGVSVKLRILVVVHCEREDGRVIRIISARKVTARERRFYEGSKL